jgi:hypothetical protein
MHIATLLFLLLYVTFSLQDVIPRHISKAPWPTHDFNRVNVGTQRISVITHASDVVWAHLPWRRRDLAAGSSTVIVLDDNGNEIYNTIVARSDSDSGDIIFQAPRSAEYQIYYLPYEVVGDSNLGIGAWEIKFKAPDYSKVDPAWRQKHNITDAELPLEKWKLFTQATILGKQARTDFDEGYDMEIIATKQEQKEFIAKYQPNNQFLVFPKFIRNTTRESIRMPQLPWLYYKYGPQNNVSADQVRPGQFVVIEIGIFPFNEMHNVQVKFSNLTSSSGAIPSSAFSVFEFGGFDMHGNPFSKVYNITKLQVGFVTVGIDVPTQTKCGIYRGQMLVTSSSLTQVTNIGLTLNISCKEIPFDRINDVWSLQRLKWLNSRLGIEDDYLPAPFIPIQVDQASRTIALLNRTITLNAYGLPEQIISNGNALLATPIQFVVQLAQGPCEWKPSNLLIQKKSASYATISSDLTCSDDSFTIKLTGLVAYDGVVDYSLVLKPKSSDIAVSDIRLQYEQVREFSTYSSGQNWDGGLFKPTSFLWSDVDPACRGDGTCAQGCQKNQVWIGEFNAGLKLKLKGNTPEWDNPSMNWTNYGVDAFPRSWGNLDGSGGLKTESNLDTVSVTAFSGARTIPSTETVQFKFNLVITPVKPLDLAAHFNKQRYYHTPYGSWEIPNLDALKYLGVTTIIFHQSNALNPHINYPTHPDVAARLAHYIKEAHQRGIKVCMYATTRELSNAVIEMWSMRNLNGEVIDNHLEYGLKGNSWLQEHLVTDYSRAWFTMEPDFKEDASIHLLGSSNSGGRYANYYIESLRWMIEVLDVDGIYFDGLTLDYYAMSRARKVFRKYKPDSYFNLDQNPLRYLEDISSFDTLWVGEGQQLNLFTPDEWLIKMSGIPFGLFGDMLGAGDGANKFWGMLFGMTNRCGFNGLDPNNNMVIWRLWDMFDIAHSEMFGWWDSAVPVKVKQLDDVVKATVYLHKGKMALIVVASWAAEKVSVSFDYNWKALGLSASTTMLTAPYMIGVQDYANFDINQGIDVQPSKGWFLILEDRADTLKWRLSG